MNEWFRKQLWLNVRFFADDGGEGGAGGAGEGDAGAADPAADPPAVPDGKAAASPQGEPSPTPDTGDGRPWYEKKDWYDERDAGILGRYKSEEEALKSLSHRERLLLDRNIDFPSDDADDETRQKAHQTILRRMGAMKKAEDYRAVLEERLNDLPDSVKGFIPDGYIDEVCAEAVENGLLPGQVKKMMETALGRFEEYTRNQQDARDGSEKTLKKIFGPRVDQVLGDVDKMCDSYDGDMFREENMKLPEQQRRERGGLVKQMWSELRNTQYGPVLARVLNYNHDRFLSEGDGSIAGFKGESKTDDAYSASYKHAQSQWPNSGKEAWESYARQKSKGK